MNVSFFRAFVNLPFVAGCVLLLIGISPLFAAMLGFFPENRDGVIFGLIMFFTFLPGVPLVIGGVVIAVKQVDGRKNDGAA